MSFHNVRNFVAILLILTAANIAASFSSLHAVHMIRDSVTASIQQLTSVTTQLCSQKGAVCKTVIVAQPSAMAVDMASAANAASNTGETEGSNK